jgi:hypothetical protein
MNTIQHDFYSGYEGEPEIRFVKKDTGGEESLRLWIGYFDRIMHQVKPLPDGWHELALHYHMATGWYDEENWKIPNLADALSQLATVRASDLDDSTTKVKQACESLIARAIDENSAVFIQYF